MYRQACRNGVFLAFRSADFQHRLPDLIIRRNRNCHIPRVIPVAVSAYDPERIQGDLPSKVIYCISACVLIVSEPYECGAVPVKHCQRIIACTVIGSQCVFNRRFIIIFHSLHGKLTDIRCDRSASQIDQPDIPGILFFLAACFCFFPLSAVR